MDVEQVEDTDYVLQFWSAEKGGFFDGTIETVGAFDPKKLKITTYEYPKWRRYTWISRVRWC